MNGQPVRGIAGWKSGNTSGIWYDPVGSLHVAYHADEWVVLQELFEVFQ